MAEQLMKPKEVQNEFGYSRATLLRYESSGALLPVRTPGGQRRYRRADIMNLGIETLNTEENAIYREFGSTMGNRWGQNVYEEKLRELRGIEGRELLHEIRMNDPVIAAVFFAVEGAMKQASWRVVAASDAQPDKDAAEFVESALYDMSFSWNDTLTLIFQMLEQGFSVLETVYKKRLGDSPPLYIPNAATSQFNDGRIGWRKWSPRPADSLAPGQEWIIDSTGGIAGINQSINFMDVITIPINKLLLFRTTIAPANNPWGMPIHRPAYLPWWYSHNIQEIEGIGIERDLAGLPVVYLGEDATMSGTNSDYDMAVELVTNIRNDEQAGVVIPKPKMGTSNAEGRGILLELLASGGKRQYDTNSIIERYDKRKALVVLAQFIMLGMDRVGSYALSNDQGDLFNIAVTAWLNSIADIINRHAIPRLMKMNVFPGITGMPKITPAPLNVPNLIEISTFINQMVEKEVLTPDDELERHLRQLAKLPQLPQEYFEEEPEDTSSGSGASAKPKKSGLRNLRGKGLSLEKAALLTRRVGLATRSLMDLGAMDITTSATLMEPLVDALVDAMRNEGLEVPDIDLNPPSQEEWLAQQAAKNPFAPASSGTAGKPDDDDDEEENEKTPDDEEDDED